MAQTKPSQQKVVFNNCAVIVAHPDDETLWAGGTMLMHAEAKWQVVTLCRGSDRERRQKFFQALARFNATGAMGDLEDGPDQSPLALGPDMYFVLADNRAAPDSRAWGPVHRDDIYGLAIFQIDEQRELHAVLVTPTPVPGALSTPPPGPAATGPRRRVPP